VVASNAECIKHAQLVDYETLAVVMRHQTLNTADCIKWERNWFLITFKAHSWHNILQNT